MANDAPFSTFRGELLPPWSGGTDSLKTRIIQQEKGCRGEVFVPVWSSQFFVNEWVQPGEPPLVGQIDRLHNNYQLRLENRLNRPLRDLHLVIDELVFQVGELAPAGRLEQVLKREQGRSLQEFLQEYGRRFDEAARQRQRALGGNRNVQLDDLPRHSIAASFGSLLNRTASPHQQFFANKGLDLTPLMQRGDGIVFAWDKGHAPGKPLNQFQARRESRNSLLRVAFSPPSRSAR